MMARQSRLLSTADPTWAPDSPLSRWLSTALRFGLAIVLFAASIPKLLDLPASVRAVRAYELLPEALVPLAGYGLPVVELSLALLLAAGLLTRPTAVAVAGMMLVFIAAIASVWARGLQIDCGCFGGGGPIAADQTAYPQEIVRDLVILAAALLLAWRPGSYLALDTPLGLNPTHPTTQDE